MSDTTELKRRMSTPAHPDGDPTLMVVEILRITKERDALLEDKARLEKRVYLIVTLCCFPDKEEADFSYENADGEKVAFTLKMPKEIMHDVANVIGPCVYHDAAIDAAKGGAR
jgi:hypothetical protein